MSNEELVAKIKEGNQELFADLWDGVKDFVQWQANKFCRRCGGEYYGLTVEDLYNSGYIGMVKAVEHFAPESGTRFITFFGYYLRSEWQAAAGIHRKNLDPLLSSMSLDVPLDGEDGSTLNDLLEDPESTSSYEQVEESIYQEQLHDALEEALGALQEELSDTLRRRFYLGQTCAEAAAELGVRPSVVRRREGEALRTLRRPSISEPLRQYIEEHTNYYYHVGVQAFQHSKTSAVEYLAVKRERLATGRP